MKKNMGFADRIIRTIVALVIGFLILNGTLAGTWAVILGLFALVFLATSFISFCPLYLPLGISTSKKPAGK